MKLIPKAMLYIFSKIAKRYKKSFEKSLKCAAAKNDELLMKIIIKNSETEYGKKYGFNSIDTPEKFKNAVPITVYDDYKAFIDRMAKGETDILTSEKVEFFGVSSGTTGNQKLIPMTQSALKSCSVFMGLLPQGILYDTLSKVWSFGRGLNLMCMSDSGRTEGDIPISSGTSGGMRSMKKIIPYVWTSPVEILKERGNINIDYIHLLFALMEEDLMYIAAPFMPSVLDALRLLENKWTDLVIDIEEGKISSQIEISEDLRNKLNKKMRPNPKRAEELKREFVLGMDGIVTRIWPKFAFVWSVAGAGFKVYYEKAKKYIGFIPVYSGVYAATEGLIGIEFGLNRAVYVAVPGSVYYEFIPIDECDSEKVTTYGMNELQVGEKYEVVITNFSGFYRYRLGDIIKVTGYKGTSPEMEFLYRKNQLISINSEKTSEHAVNQAINETIKHLGAELVDYTVMADINVSPGRYVFFVEVKNPENIDKIEAGKTLENELYIANPRYEQHRKAGKIGQVSLELVEPGTFDLFKKFLLSKGASKNQVKIPRVIKKDDLAEFLKNSTYDTQEVELCGL